MNFLEYAKKKDNINKRLIEEIGPYKIYLVNGEEVRKLDIDSHEFGDSGNHIDFPKLVPKNEIWVDDITNKKELFLIIFQSIKELEIGDKDAYEKSLKEERKLREILSGIKYHPSKWSEGKPNKKIYKEEYGKIGDILVWLVDGELVRDLYKTDFIEGGHGHIYDFIPNNEIWIEYNIHEKEIPLIILHEYVERTLMKVKRMEYAKAHVIASKVEYDNIGITKEKVLGLDEKDVLNMVKKK